MRIRFPLDFMFCQHMVITTDTQTNRTIRLVGQFCIRKRIEIQIDYIVQSTYGSMDNTAEFLLIFHINISQRKRCQITNHKLSGFCSVHYNSFAINRFCLLADGRNGTHILCNFCTQIGAINHTLVSVWIHFVNMVTVKGKWSSCFHCRFNNQSNEFFDWNDAFRDTVVSHTIKISFFPFFSVIILQSITFYR